MNSMSSARYWTVAAAAGACLLAVPATASADPLPAECTQPDPVGPVTCTYTSGTSALVLPVGVSSIQIAAIGGRGGNDSRVTGYVVTGGQGAVATATVPVSARTLYAVVGGNGSDTDGGNRVGVGGANGGGNGGAPSQPNYVGSGGGGASDVRTDPLDLASRLVVAGAGGGATFFHTGGAAGASGTGAGYSGGAGTDTTAGAGGGSDSSSGLPGSFGVGGTGGADRYSSGGGGGGGWFGGGGGGGGGAGVSFGGGGGGSSLAPNGGTVALTTAPPSITITYQPPSTPPPTACTGSVCLPTGTFGSS
ncbi:glycine rich domain-containing protein [Rhodococcus ruber]|uniref:receptor protein-tyrosine kinase n=1 Tax=Rhodococcus ruber TaxID=1830 RepID=A0ABT4MKU7_9NOCA|nr:glycine rich domain-containing protein [Rhodococcus ruber]MCZ4521609.1 glycine rich domain-containing protein [Rhodococcus ruber]